MPDARLIVSRLVAARGAGSDYPGHYPHTKTPQKRLSLAPCRLEVILERAKRSIHIFLSNIFNVL